MRKQHLARLLIWVHSEILVLCCNFRHLQVGPLTYPLLFQLRPIVVVPRSPRKILTGRVFPSSLIRLPLTPRSR